jgi:hypothetical protein
MDEEEAISKTLDDIRKKKTEKFVYGQGPKTSLNMFLLKLE